MPRLPGRESTRMTIEVEHALITSFIMQWEDKVANKVCCITGCDHKCSGQLGELGDGNFCSSQAAGVVIDERKPPEPDPFVGWACPHHVDEILAIRG